MNSSRLQALVERAWRAFDDAAGRSWHVAPAAPILFFGDLAAYRDSRPRVLTVGLNPSLREFPADEPFRRFPLAEGERGREPSRYLDAMSAYFRTCPYRGWFSAFEPLLEGMGASYYEGCASTALHTDICSPVATNPTWSGLDGDARDDLAAAGVPLWHGLLKELRPEIVVLSVAEEHLKRIEFDARTEWRTIHVFARTESGRLRARPYKLCAGRYDVNGERTLFGFGQAAQKPFGTLADCQKREAGKLLLKEYRNGR